ncbi:MAG: histidinol-phosphate transaminase [Bacillota bacterium]|nr:histidinol-phosphate transaminase [Bacillota bacterium]
MRFHGGMHPDQYLDFSVNVPVRPLTEEARQHIGAALERVHLYPSIDNAALSRRLSHVLGASAVLGAGATQLIYAVGRVLIGKRVLILEPAFTEYEAALKRSDICHCNMIAEGFAEWGKIPNYDQIVDEIRRHRADAVFLCNPNNPVGSYSDDLVEILLERTDALLVLDESFIDFVDEIRLSSHNQKMADLIARHRDRLIVIRSMTKAFSVPGIRIGYVLTSESLSCEIIAEMEPWSVSCVGSAFVEYILDANKIEHSGVNTYREERERMIRKIEEAGFPCNHSSCVNYFLMKSRAGLNERLHAHGLNIRTCKDFMFLGEEYYRINVRSYSDNERLLETLKKTEFTAFTREES